MSKKNTIVMDSENNQDIFDSQFINDIDRIILLPAFEGAYAYLETDGEFL